MPLRWHSPIEHVQNADIKKLFKKILLIYQFFFVLIYKKYIILTNNRFRARFYRARIAVYALLSCVLLLRERDTILSMHLWSRYMYCHTSEKHSLPLSLVYAARRREWMTRWLDSLPPPRYVIGAWYHPHPRLMRGAHTQPKAHLVYPDCDVYKIFFYPLFVFCF